jgi:hypothetical protein
VILVVWVVLVVWVILLLLVVSVAWYLKFFGGLCVFDCLRCFGYFGVFCLFERIWSFG